MGVFTFVCENLSSSTANHIVLVFRARTCFIDLDFVAANLQDNETPAARFCFTFRRICREAVGDYWVELVNYRIERM